MIISPTDQVCFWEWEITANHQLTFLFKHANPLPLRRQSLWCNEQMRRNPLLNHVLFLQTKYILRSKSTSGRTGRTGSAGQNRLPLFDNDQVGSRVCFMSRSLALNANITSKTPRKRRMKFEHRPWAVEQLTRLKSWFLSCHPRQVLGCLKKLVYDWLLQKVPASLL